MTCCRYKGSMDARTCQQHAARVAELADTLLAERAADKAASAHDAISAGALGAESDSTGRHPDSGSAGSATPSTASPSDRCSSSPGKSCGPAAPAGGTQMLLPAEKAEHRDTQAASVVRDTDESHPSGLLRDRAAAASSSACASAGGKITNFPPSGDAAGVLCGPYYCTVCNVSTTSAVHLQTHYMGSKHQRRLAQSQDSRDPSPHYCPICAISATSAVHLQLHLNGRAHQRKAKLAAQAETRGSKYPTAALGICVFPEIGEGARGRERGGDGRNFTAIVNGCCMGSWYTGAAIISHAPAAVTDGNASGHMPEFYARENAARITSLLGLPKAANHLRCLHLLLTKVLIRLP